MDERAMQNIALRLHAAGYDEATASAIGLSKHAIKPEDLIAAAASIGRTFPQKNSRAKRSKPNQTLRHWSISNERA